MQNNAADKDKEDEFDVGVRNCYTTANCYEDKENLRTSALFRINIEHEILSIDLLNTIFYFPFSEGEEIAATCSVGQFCFIFFLFVFFFGVKKLKIQYTFREFTRAGGRRT